MRNVFVCIFGLIFIAMPAFCVAETNSNAEKAAAEAADKWVFAVVNVIDTKTELRKELKQHGDAAYDVLSKLYDSEQAVNHYFLRRSMLETLVEINPSRATKFIETNVFVKGPRNQKSTASYLLGKIASPDSIQLLIRQFDAKDRRDRANARQAMNRTKGAALNEILKTLVNGSDVARTEAALCLKDLTLYDSTKARVIKVTAERLNDPCPDVRRALTRCAYKYNRTTFIQCLQSEDIAKRLQAFTCIRGQRDRSYFDIMIHAAKDTSVEVRCQVAMALYDQSDESAVKTLVTMTNDKDKQVRIYARRSLIWGKGTIKEKMVQPFLKNADPENRATAVALLAKCDPPPIKQILAIARDKKTDTDMRKVATIKILEHAKNPLVLEFARELFEDPNRLKQTYDFGRIKAWILPNSFLHWQKAGTGAGLALIQYGNADDAMRIVNNAGKGHVIPRLCGLLFEMGDKAIPALKAAMHMENVDVKKEALSSLAQFKKNKEALSIIRIALSDVNATIRGKAAVYLANLGDSDSVDILAGLLKDENEYARSHAATALVMLGDKRGDKIAFDWHKKQLKSFVDYNSWLFLMKYAVPLGSTKQQAAEIFSIPAGTNGQGNLWSYSPIKSMIISLKFKDGVLIGTFPAEKDLEITIP